MAEFIRLDEQEQEAPILPDYPHSISNIKPDTKIIDGVIEKEEVEGICADYSVITIDKIDSVKVEEEGVDHICIKDDCDTSKYYGCTGGDDGFQKENLFSELTDEYQRTIARINLGIADEYALKWGNIKGNLSNQKDLYTFVTDSIAFDINKVIDEINLKLAQWACEIEIRFKNKADIFSPNFTGTPTTTLPLMTDNSDRIASTEWVNAKIAAASIDDNVKAISLDPEYMCYGDEPTDVKVTWEYHKDVIEQSINGVVLSPDVREYTFTNRTTSMVITLKYKYEDISATRVVTFDIKYPNYFGTSPDYTKLDRTIDNVYTVNAGANEYIYVMIPNGANTVLGVSSIIGGFKLLGTQEIFSNLYYIFKSAQPGLGETTVEILDQSGYNPESIDTTTIRELLAAKADKHTVYTKEEVDDKLAAIEGGDIQLNNYYTKKEVDDRIPDVSNKADKSEIPTKVSQLENDSEYLSEVPEEYVTDKELEAKGYLTQELEPQFAASAAKNINQQDINSWNNKVDKQDGMGLSEQNFTIEEKVKLSGLTNYNDSGIRQSISELTGEVQKKANKTDIPDISGKADKTEIPTRVSQLENDSGYLNSLPSDLVTEQELEAKGYLTEFTETDPTVPSWAKQPTKPTYTLSELGAESAGAAANALLDAKSYTDGRFDIILEGADPSYNTFKKLSDAILAQNTTIGGINTEISGIKNTLNNKADKSELFSKDYNDLINTPIIPSIEGLATETWVQQQIAAIPGVDLSGYALKTEIPDVSIYVEKVPGMGLSSNDFTSEDKNKLNGLNNYDDSTIRGEVNELNIKVKYLNSTIPFDMVNSSSPNTYFNNIDEAIEFLELLYESSTAVIEYNEDTDLVVYNKVGTDVTDINDRRAINVTLLCHLSTSQDFKMTFNLVSGNSEESFNYSKEVINVIANDLVTNRTDIPLSAAQGKLLMDKLTALEEIVNNITTNASIILE
jgi:hypothetical protein|nr:MAG TPA: hypothetical protein [Caudoviricetes sp.]